MIAEAHDQEGLVGEVALQPRLERLIVDRAQMLTPQIFVHVRPVAEVLPVGRQIGTEAEVPREMVLRGVDQQEQRVLAARLRDRLRRLVEIERVRIEEIRAERR